MPNKPKGNGAERAEVDAWLRSKGIGCALAPLATNLSLAPRCVARLLELLTQPWSPATKATVAEAQFARSSDPSRKRKAMGLVVAALKNCPAKDKKGMAIPSEKAFAYIARGFSACAASVVSHK